MNARFSNGWTIPLATTCASVFVSAALASAQGNPQALASRNSSQLIGVAEGRLHIFSPTNSLKLAEKNELPIELHGQKVHSVEIKVSYYNSDGAAGAPDVDTETALLHHADGSTYLQLVPEKIGKAQIVVIADFEDGMVENESVDVDIVPTDQKPIKLTVVTRQGHGTLYMSLTGSVHQTRIFPQALYQTMTNPVFIPAKYVSFHLLAANAGAPPIKIDDLNGTITALRPGHALIQTTLGGMSTLTCVAVSLHAGDGSDRTNCTELVPEGMAPPLTGFENAGPPPKVKVEHTALRRTNNDMAPQPRSATPNLNCSRDPSHY